jgi:hypothetical protein
VKKLLSLLLIVLILFNVLGYYGFFLGLQYQNSQEMMAKFDAEEYSTSEAITIKVPITIPYASDSREYERVNGQFEHQGEFYRLVKQRLLHDTLFIVCVKDQQSKNIDQALASYVKTFTDKPVDNHSNAKTFSLLSKDYLSHTMSISQSSSGWSFDVVKKTSLLIFIPTFYPSIDPPPDRVLFV